MLKKAIYIVFIILFLAMAFEIYSLDKDRRSLSREMANIGNELELIEKDNSNLNDQIDYFSEPRNLEKELRSRFNYRLPFEKLIIVIPDNDE